MAKFVIAGWLFYDYFLIKFKFENLGKANCPHYAKAELLGDELTLNLPGFRIHKIPVDPNNWDVGLRKN